MAQTPQPQEQNGQPFSHYEPVDLSQTGAGMTEPARNALREFLNQLIADDALSAHVYTKSGAVIQYQIKHLNTVEEIRCENVELHHALAALRALLDSPSTDITTATLHVTGSQQELDLNFTHLPSPHGDQYVLRVQVIDPVPMVLDTLGLPHNDLRLLRTALAEPNGLISIGTPHRRHLENWQRALCRELSAPDRSVAALVPRLLEEIPRVSQSEFPPGQRSDQRLWQLASQTDTNVFILVDDGTHGYAPDQIGVLAERSLVIQVLQVTHTSALLQRTPSHSRVHRVIMHLPLRMLCQDCCETQTNPSRSEYPFLDRALPTLSDGVNAWLAASQSIQFKKAAGCKSCNGAGYTGERCVVDAIKDEAILKDPANLVDMHQLNISRTARMIEMAREGEISLDEILRLQNSSTQGY